MAFYMHMCLPTSFGERWTNIDYCSWNPRPHSNGENPSDANVQTNKVQFLKGKPNKKKDKMKQGDVQLFLLFFMQKNPTDSNRGHESYATLWLILKGYYKKQWLISNDDSEVSEELIQEFSGDSRTPLYVHEIITRKLKKSVKMLSWKQWEFPTQDNKGSDVYLKFA